MTDQIPPTIAAAIVEVMSNVKRLAKAHKNPHGKFAFTSIDDFLEAVGPLCADAGLIIMQDEDQLEMIQSRDSKGADTSWLRITYSFTMAHKDGEMWAHRPKRTAFVRASMGPQATGAAQSYALKQFERALFHIPTGDVEDDDTPAGMLPSREPVHGAITKTKLQGELRAFDRDLHRCSDESELDGLLASYDDVLEQCKRDLPTWWNTQDRSDTIGINDRIAQVRAKLQKEAADTPSPPAPRKEDAPAASQPGKVETEGAQGAGADKLGLPDDRFAAVCISEIILLKAGEEMDWANENEAAIKKRPKKVQDSVREALRAQR